MVVVVTMEGEGAVGTVGAGEGDKLLIMTMKCGKTMLL